MKSTDTDFLDILARYRRESFSESAKGAKFERLMRVYLLARPQYKGLFEKVWLWHDFPFRRDFGDGHDIGIDLVAKTVTGEYWAVQCKCYAEDAFISKEDVDTFISTSGKKFGDDKLEPQHFSQRLWISTTNHWSSHAETSLHNQSPSVMRINLEDLSSDSVDWDALEASANGGKATAHREPRTPKDYQETIIKKTHDYFKDHDRGKLIMACGTGKTYTSLKIAEAEVKPNGLVLFLVPSIALLGQTLAEWTAHAENALRPMCVCSDAAVSKKSTKDEDSDGFSVVDLAFPAVTNVDEIIRQFRSLDLMKTNKGFRVVFSTYQSLPQVIKAQKALNAGGDHHLADFDLVICDEAHRTTGATVKDAKDSSFVLVHSNDNLVARKRLYMTATPRVYNDKAKDDAKAADAYICSMDDANIYGEEIHRLGFGEAVQKNILSDYKVLVLAVPNIPKEFEKVIQASDGSLRMDDAAKLVGCTNALSKILVRDSQSVVAEDASLMHKAVAFCGNIKDSKRIVESFNKLHDEYFKSLTPEEREARVVIEAQHVDGSMGAGLRQQKLAWLNDAPSDTNVCHVLSNVRCLSEGVDVPSLDAILFLSAKNSQVDVVQSVGRVMRKAPGKKYGYVIIPIVVPANMTADEALDQSEVYNVVWTVLNALRAHDDRFEAEINKIDLNKNGSGKIVVDVIGKDRGGEGGDGTGNGTPSTTQDEFDLRAKIYAKMVKKVGTRRYWSLWAEEVAKIAARHSDRLREIISKPGPKHDEFLKFLASLRENLNPAVSEEEAADMLVQHALTKPVFDAVFGNYDFASSNVVSKAMQKTVDLLHEEIPDNERKALEEFYKSVAERAEGIDNAEGKQRVIYELYDKFFRAAFPKMSEQLGIVYTPVECVDFIINSVEDVLKQEFGQSLTDRDVHVIDPFTGTGTFVTRLLQSGHIAPKDLPRKYASELHANEIVLLAYYIASVNIESVYHDLVKSKYTPFEGICLTDTFELYEKDGAFETKDFQQNSARVQKQRKSPIRIVIGNPPYSVGQKSANDNAQNQHYPKLEQKIADTYAKRTAAANKNALYDSYIKAFRWATDRLEGGKGIVAFISNAGWLDASAMDGFRATLQDEFDAIYVFNLRGNCRTSGELRKKESGNVFGFGSRTPIAITLLVRTGNGCFNAEDSEAQRRGEVCEGAVPTSKTSPRLPNSKTSALKKSAGKGKAKIYYRDIGDYLSREKKLEIIKELRSMLDPRMNLVEITPNEKNDWINQRDGLFDSLIPMECDGKFNASSQSAFVVNSRGFETARDAWVYNCSRDCLLETTKKMVSFFNKQVKEYAAQPDKKLKAKDFITYDATKISWSANLVEAVQKGKSAKYEPEKISLGVYRPFFRQHVYCGEKFINRRGQFDSFFPTPTHKNRVICTVGAGVTKPFSCLMTDVIPDVQLLANGQCFPLYVYTKETGEQLSLFDTDAGGYRRESGITDFMLNRCRAAFGEKVTKEDVFYYIYAILHSPDYRSRFEPDLKKSLARIPLCATGADFAAFVKAGRKLGDLHCGYETAKPWPDCVVDVAGGDLFENSPRLPNSQTSALKNTAGKAGVFALTKMRFAKKDYPVDENHNGKLDRWELEDRGRIIYNDRVTIRGIPMAAYDYVVNGKSAIEWIMERYQVTTNKDSGIVNDPNAWLSESGNPRYVVDLILKVVTVSMETNKIVSRLPRLTFDVPAK
jgi:predicted helicase